MSSAELITDLYAEARNHMVDSQLRPNKVTDPRITGAMRRLPRERFLPPAQRHLAYIDEDVSLGNGRVLMEPMVLARLIQLAAPGAGERALVVAAGAGYGAAVLAACGPRVTALEEDPKLLDSARGALSAVAPEINLVSGPLASGWANGAPYDVILIEGAVHAIPAALGQQLRADGGRLVTVLRNPDGRTSSAVLAEPTPMGLRAQPMFDCATPDLPSLRPAPVFEF
jgi:protein-L-isoaspartate(D-aspartate) O-methyltransferase